MPVQDFFSEEEWKLLSIAPPLVGAAMSGAAFSGVMGSIKEALANSKTILEGAKKYPENELIQEVVNKPNSWGDAKQRNQYFQEILKEKMQANDIKKPEEMVDFVLCECENLNTLLEEKASLEQTAQYKEWLLTIANNVASAAKEGGTLGFGGVRVSDSERDFYDRLKTTLKVEDKTDEVV